MHDEVRAKIQQAIGPHEDLLTIVKRRKLQLYGHASCSSGLAKTILQGTVKGGRRQGGQRKRWEDNKRKWTGLEFGKSQRAVENREKKEKTGCKSISAAPTTLADKGLMMMMMMMMMMNINCLDPQNDITVSQYQYYMPPHYFTNPGQYQYHILPHYSTTLRQYQYHMPLHHSTPTDNINITYFHIIPPP